MLAFFKNCQIIKVFYQFASISGGKYLVIVSNKAKGRISKRVFQEICSRQIFRKTYISYPLTRTRRCAYQGVRNIRFSENLVALFS